MHHTSFIIDHHIYHSSYIITYISSHTSLIIHHCYPTVRILSRCTSIHQRIPSPRILHLLSLSYHNPLRWWWWPEARIPSWPEARFPRWPEARIPPWPEARIPRWPEARIPRWPEARIPHRQGQHLPSDPHLSHHLLSLQVRTVGVQFTLSCNDSWSATSTEWCPAEVRRVRTGCTCVHVYICTAAHLLISIGASWL